MKQIYVLFLFTSLTLACSRPNVTNLPDAYFEGIDSYSPPCTDSTATTVQNCGRCGNACPAFVTDRCTTGQCLCGTSPPCNPETEECRYGICRPVDRSGRVCEFDRECGAPESGLGCILGHCSRIECTPEICDAVDNDCDGNIDGDERGPVARYCYDIDIPASEPLTDPCRRGVQVCSYGEWQACEGAVTPVAEAGLFACDATDNDCDGCVDGVATPGGCVPAVNTNFDIVFIIDTSGSMAEEINTIVNVIRTFSGMFSSNLNFRFALVQAPEPGHFSTTRPSSSNVLLPLSSYESFTTAFVIENLRGSIAPEPTLDVIWEIGTGVLNVGWRESSARILVLFTDEEGQSYRPTPVTEEDMCGQLTSGEVFYYFTLPTYREYWDLCGNYFQLSTDEAQVLSDLTTVVSDPCSP